MPAVVDKPKSKTENKAPVKLNKFRLLRGRHVDKTTGENVTYQVTKDPVTKRINQPIFESKYDLDRIHNSPGLQPKFERVGEQTQIILNPLDRYPGETLQVYLGRLSRLQESIQEEVDKKVKEVDALEDADLVPYAEAEEINIEGAKGHKQVREAIKKALKG